MSDDVTKGVAKHRSESFNCCPAKLRFFSDFCSLHALETRLLLTQCYPNVHPKPNNQRSIYKYRIIAFQKIIISPANFTGL